MFEIFNGYNSVCGAYYFPDDEGLTVETWGEFFYMIFWLYCDGVKWTLISLMQGIEFLT